MGGSTLDNAVPPRQPVIVCLDKFRGSISAAEASDALAEGMKAADPTLMVSSSPIADGGEGTAEVLKSAGYKAVTARVTGPTGQLVDAELAFRSGRAVVELAQAAGLHLSDRDAVHASTYGVGEMIRAALDLGCREIVLAIGGSATTDGGAGMLQALGARLLDREGAELPTGGGELVRLASVDMSGIDPRLAETEFGLATDVSNPLLGSEGAAAVFAPQKGASPRDVSLLEAALGRLADLMEDELGVRVRERSGAGAAGGTGFAALCLGAVPVSGVQFILEETGVSERLQSASTVVVGEGSLDSQSLQGKAPIAIARLAQSHRIPVLAVAGRIRLTPEAMLNVGIRSWYALVDDADNELDAMHRAPELLRALGMRLATLDLASDTDSSRQS